MEFHCQSASPVERQYQEFRQYRNQFDWVTK